MKKSDLHREFARVLDMCDGMSISPFDCVKYFGTRGLPLDFVNDPHHYQFALAIVEGKPVFEGDELYVTDAPNRKVKVKEAAICSVSMTDGSFWAPDQIKQRLSWNPPKRTFLLNGEELPLPEGGGCEYFLRSTSLPRDTYWKNPEDRDKVEQAIIKLLRGE
jgi:hypothetical protein